MIYVHAGHQPLLVFNKATILELTIGGTVIGSLPEVRFQRGFIRLEEGDILLIYTDGIIERRDSAGELFGVDRLKNLVLKNLQEPAKAILDAIFAEVGKFGGSIPWEEDATLIAVKRKARGSKS